MADAKTVLVLGGGVGGIAAANRLRRRLPSAHRVVLVDQARDHLFQPSLLWLAVGARQLHAIQRPLERLLRRGVEIQLGTVERIDPSHRTVHVGGRELAGDALIIALGADLAPETVPGLAESGHNLYTASGATAFREALTSMESGRIVVLTATPAYKCPAAPYEAAMLVECVFRRRGIRDRVRLDVYAAEPGPMGVTGPAVSGAVRAMVESRGIAYHPDHQVTAVDPAARLIAFTKGATAAFDLLLYVPPHRAPAALRGTGVLGDNGWVAADRHTFETAFPGVFAVGDVVGIPLLMGKPLPKAGVFARAQAEVVAENIANAWTGNPVRRRFDGTGACFVEVGDGRAGFGAGNFYAEPTPDIRLHAPAPWWHWSKVLYERLWLSGLR